MHIANTALIYPNGFLRASEFQGQIESFVRFIHELASGIEGELVLSSITDLKITNFAFAVGDAEGMSAKAIQEAGKTKTNVYFGSYVARRGACEGNKRGSREDIVAVLMLGVDQDADHQRAGALP